MLLFLFVGLVYGDVYMHSPRGANDRNCERNVNRNNGNLLYDTQNNAKGGYACPRAVASSAATFPAKGLTPKLVFQEGSKLEVEWTAQHGSGNAESDEKQKATALNIADAQNVHSELVVQLGCASTLDPAGVYGKMYTGQAGLEYLAVPREGIPNTDNDAATNRAGTADPGVAQGAAAGTNLRFGIHETPAWYNECNRVERNKGLFTADQNVNRRSAIGTRQNPNGGRRGLECPEERDYYPYWRPSPFLDVAYLVDDKARCGSGITPCGGTNAPCGVVNGGTNDVPLTGDWVGNSAGYSATQTPGAGAVAHGLCTVTTADGNNIVPKTAPARDAANNNAQRNAYNQRRWPNSEAACTAIGATWTKNMFTSMFTMAATSAQWTATPALAVQAAASMGAECKVIDASRSNHLGNSNTDDTASRYTMTIPTVNPATLEAQSTTTGEPCFLRLRYNMSSSDYARDANAALNGNNSPIQQDPLVKVGPGASDVVQLALNTNQVARTFQDRSYVFYIKPKTAPQGIEVINVNVRGKRGNIVQTYPAVEYDMIPNKIKVDPQTELDIQWVGSDYNPRRGCNDGEGGPYRGDNNVANGLNANTQGSNQNSRTDRMTLLGVRDPQKNYPNTGPADTTTPSMMAGPNELFTVAQAKRFAYADAHAHFAQLAEVTGQATLNCLTATEINAINNENRQENHPRNCAEGNALLPYFQTETIKFTSAQENQNFMAYSPRNNNFSNRDSKFIVMVVAATNPLAPPALNPAEFILPAATNKPQFVAYTEEEIEAGMEADVPGFDPVENDDYGTGAKEGCTQEMLTFASAPAAVSAFSLMACSLLTAFYTSV